MKIAEEMDIEPDEDLCAALLFCFDRPRMPDVDDQEVNKQKNHIKKLKQKLQALLTKPLGSSTPNRPNSADYGRISALEEFLTLDKK